jgi:hypothetical protein
MAKPNVVKRIARYQTRLTPEGVKQNLELPHLRSEVFSIKAPAS